MTELTRSEKDIISYLLDEPEATRYDVKKELEIPYGTAHGSFKSLEEKSLIREAREEKTKKGTTKTYFSLTPLGTLRAVSEKIRSMRPERVPVTFETGEGQAITLKPPTPELANWEDMPKSVEEQLDPEFLEELDEYGEEEAYQDELHKIAKKRGDALPLILGKWNFFEDQGIENVIALRILNAPSELNWRYLTKKAKTRDRDLNEILARNFYSELFSHYEDLQSIILGKPTDIPGLKKIKGWTFEEIAITLAKDPDLAPIVKQRVGELHAKNQKEHEIISRLRNELSEEAEQVAEIEGTSIEGTRLNPTQLWKDSSE